MKKVFVDTNILVDLIADRKPFSKYAIKLFKYSEENKVQLYASSHSIATTHYILKKYLDEKRLSNILLGVLDFIQVISIDPDTLRKGLRSAHPDFEDALQILCASSIKDTDFIITRNIKDFKNSQVRVLPPEDAIAELNYPS